VEKRSDILAQKIREGDEASFEILFNAEFNNIVYFVNGYLHDISTSKDIAQDSLWKLWEVKDTIDASKSLRAYVFTIARNRTINELKSLSRKPEMVNVDEVKADLIALNDDSLKEELDTLDLQKLIDQTIDNLPDTVRGSFIMSRRYGMTNKEIAKAKNISLTGVEYHMKISLRILKEKLKDYLTH
jgi:RNA polymerase sigma-70 factor (ECF subfamily)